MEVPGNAQADVVPVVVAVRVVHVERTVTVVAEVAGINDAPGLDDILPVSAHIH